MMIRYARPGDLEEVRSLWIEGFGDPQPYTKWYFRTIYQPERTLCLWDGPNMAACLQIAPYRLMLNGQPHRVAYLVGVVTGQAYRHRGFGHQLVQYALNQLSASEFSLAMLYTDIPEFYAPLGFIHCYQQCLQRFSPKNMSPPPGWRLSLQEENDLARCDQIYQRMTKTMNGYILRSPKNWKNLLADFLCDGGDLWISKTGYLLWYPDLDGTCFRIHELGYATQTALEEALALAQGLAANHGYTQIAWSSPLSTPKLGEDLRIIPHVMCRRLDLPREYSEENAATATLDLYEKTWSANWVNEIT